MDSYHHQSNWYPSSSPPPPPPTAGGAGGYSHHNPNPNPNPHLPYPHIPHHQQWPPPSENYLHHQHQQFQPPPPPYHSHAPAGLPPRYPAPPPPAAHMQQHNYPPMPPIPRPHHSFPPPSQAWGNPSWTQHQGREYPERSIPYNNEEDWAARARAWAASKSGMENHHMQSHFAPIGRADEHSYAYHDQYQQPVDSRTDVQQPSHPQSSVQHLPNTATDPQRQVNNLHVSAPFNSGSSYDIGYNAGDEAIATNTDHMASPQKNYVPSSSIYEQEVPYSYSSAPGNRGAVNQNKGSNFPLPLPMASIQEGHHLLSSLPLQMSSAEQPHFPHHGQRADFLPGASDRPLEFESRPSSDYESHEKLNYGHSGPTGVMGVVDHDAHVSPISSWNTAAATGVGYPQIPLAPAGTQFDSSFIPQVHPAPIFGRIPPSSFQPNLPPVSAPFGLGPGSSLNHPAGFPGDTNGGLNLSERPKKAAVPNWLREEIIKKKAVLPSIVPMQPTGNSLYSIGPDDADKSLRRADQADSRSIDSNKSEDEEDDEEDVEAARSAAINQEIKRVLTEVLLKVTDELFDEIATKVLDEEQIVEVEENAIVGKQKVSSPPTISTPKASAKILVPFKVENDKVNGFAENSRTSSPGGDILGLGNYASDASDDDGDEIRSSSLLSSGNKVGASHQLESNDQSFQNDLSEGNGEHLNGPTQKKSASSYEGNHMTEKRSAAADNLKYQKASLGSSVVYEETVLTDSAKVNEFPSVNGTAHQPDHNVDEKTGRGQESTSGHANHDKFVNRDYQDRECKSDLAPDKNPVVTEPKDNMYKTRREISDKNDSVSHEDRSKLKDKLNKREKAKERAGDRSSDRRANVKESDSRRSSKDDRKDAVKDRREKDKEAGERKRERGRDEKEDRSTRDSKSSSRYTGRRSPTPSGRGKNSKDNSVSYGSASGDEPSDNSRKRMQQSVNNSLSPSPTRSRKRQVSRSPPSKHSHRRHSPYPSSERRKRRSRSISPVHQKRSSAHKHER